MERTTLAERITNDFAYHAPPTSDVAELHGEIRAALGSVAQFVAMKTPPGREQSTALTKLEEAMMWANAAIARNSAPAGSGEAVAPSA